MAIKKFNDAPKQETKKEIPHSEFSPVDNPLDARYGKSVIDSNKTFKHTDEEVTAKMEEWNAEGGLLNLYVEGNDIVQVLLRSYSEHILSVKGEQTKLEQERDIVEFITEVQDTFPEADDLQISAVLALIANLSALKRRLSV